MANSRLENLQTELMQKENELKKTLKRKQKDENDFFYSIAKLGNFAENYDDQIKLLKEEIEELKSEIEKNKSIFDVVGETLGKAKNTVINSVIPHSWIKEKQMTQLQESRKRSDEIREKYNFNKKS